MQTPVPASVTNGGALHLGGWLDWDNNGCPWDRFDERAAEVVSLCCGDDRYSLVCQNGNMFPATVATEAILPRVDIQGCL